MSNHRLGNIRARILMRYVPDVSSCKWQLDDVAAAKRSRVFWQMFTQDTWLVRHIKLPYGSLLTHPPTELRLRTATEREPRLRRMRHPET